MKDVSKKELQEIRSQVMYDVLEAKSYLIIADDVLSIVGDHGDLIQIICNKLTQSDEFLSLMTASIGSIIKTCGMLQNGELDENIEED